MYLKLQLFLVISWISPSTSNHQNSLQIYTCILYCSLTNLHVSHRMQNPKIKNYKYIQWLQAGWPRGRSSSPCRVKNFNF
jgi:hypothetical protein